MDIDGVLTKLRRRINGTSQRQVAADIGISPQLLCDILRGYRRPNEMVLNHLGLQEVVTYKPL